MKDDCFNYTTFYQAIIMRLADRRDPWVRDTPLAWWNVYVVYCTGSTQKELTLFVGACSETYGARSPSTIPPTKYEKNGYNSFKGAKDVKRLWRPRDRKWQVLNPLPSEN
jgi:hypothetical protein